MNKPTNHRSIDRYRSLRFHLLHTCSWLNDGVRQFLLPYEITPKQYSILIFLGEQAPESLSIQEVRDRLADKMSDASRLVNRLASKGLVTKFPSESDGRSNRARLTSTGKKLLARIERDKDSLDELIGSRLSNEEIDQLMELLERLR